eukprot:4352286-Amphidinium_carterae.2
MAHSDAVISRVDIAGSAIMIIPFWPKLPIALTLRLRLLSSSIAPVRCEPFVLAKQNDIRLDIPGQTVDVEADEVTFAKHAQ